MALGDKPKDQTVAPKKAPKLAQLTANSNINAGGNNTAAAGSNNFSNIQSPERAKLDTGLAKPGIFSTSGIMQGIANIIEGTNTSIPDIKPVFNSTPIDQKATIAPTTLASNITNPDNTITSPAQIGRVAPLPYSPTGASSSIGTPSSTGTSGSEEMTLAEKYPGIPRPSYMTNEDGLKTLHVAGGTISSRSPRFGNSTPERLADLDKTLAYDRDPQVIANRAAEAERVQKSFDNSLRGGLSRQEYENPLGSTQLMKGLQAAKARGDAVGFGMYRDLLKEQLGNETTRAGQQGAAENARLSNQAEAARLGYTQAKDISTAEALQRNKGIEQSIDVQKHNDIVTQNFANWATDLTKGGMAPPSTKLATATQLGIVPDDATILGEDKVRQLSEERDPSAKMQLLTEFFNGDPVAINLWIKSHQTRR